MQVTLQPPPRLVRGGDDPGARGGQLGAALGVGDGGAHKFGELGETVLGLIGKGPGGGRDRHQSPDGPVDGDRRASDAVQPDLAGLGGEGAAPV